MLYVVPKVGTTQVYRNMLPTPFESRSSGECSGQPHSDSAAPTPRMLVKRAMRITTPYATASK